MARLQPAYPLEEAELAALPAGERVGRQTQGIFAHRPAQAEAFANLMASFGDVSCTLPPRLIDLVRLRIAFWNQCRSCMSLRYQPDAVSEDLVCSLERPAQADDLTEAEKSALRFADLMASNHLAIDEDVYDDLRLHFTEGELVELGIYCAAAVGIGRLAATWAMHDHLHERFRGEQEQAFTPWGEGALR